MVFIIARGVGFLVAVAAFLVIILFLSFLRAIVGYGVQKVGVTGLLVFFGIIVYFSLKYGHIPVKMLRIVLTRSCN